MGSRLELHSVLTDICDHVYFQPPESIKIVYPAIIYSREAIRQVYANNEQYLKKKRYSVIVIDKNPDTSLVDLVSALPLCEYSRHYEKDNLNYDAFSLYF